MRDILSTLYQNIMGRALKIKAKIKARHKRLVEGQKIPSKDKHSSGPTHHNVTPPAASLNSVFISSLSGSTSMAVPKVKTKVHVSYTTMLCINSYSG